MEVQPGLFLRANDRFALDLLKTAHSESPDRNIVIAPLPISLAFGALWIEALDSSKELEGAFYWDGLYDQSVAARMILARFTRPKARSSRRPAQAPVRAGKAERLYFESLKREEMWLSLAFLYRGAGSLSPQFIEKARDFGLRFRAVGGRDTQSGVVAKDWDTSLPLPKFTQNDDFWITSHTHLREPWTGSDFNAERREFKLRSGEVVQADFMQSSSGLYPYARTEQFEAVALGCEEATVMLVLPTGNHRIEELEATIAQRPDWVESLLKKGLGDVLLPPFHFSFDANLRNAIEALGVHRIFHDPRLLYLVAKKGGVLSGIAQKTEITVDKYGIRTDSGNDMLGGSGVGGMPVGAVPFHMTLDRPFLFLIRDNTTGALLFDGVVMNPTLQ